MKTKTLVLTGILVLAVAAMVFVFASCDNGGGNGGVGSFTYDGTTYQLSHGWVEYSGTGNGPHSFDIALFSSDINWDPTTDTGTGTGEAIWIHLYSSTSPIAEGTYTFAIAPPYIPNIFVDFWVMINYNAETDVGDLYITEAGTVTITEVGDSSISLDFDVTLDDGNTATGTWTGDVISY